MTLRTCCGRAGEWVGGWEGRARKPAKSGGVQACCSTGGTRLGGGCLVQQHARGEELPRVLKQLLLCGKKERINKEARKECRAMPCSTLGRPSSPQPSPSSAHPAGQRATQAAPTGTAGGQAPLLPPLPPLPLHARQQGCGPPQVTSACGACRQETAPQAAPAQLQRGPAAAAGGAAAGEGGSGAWHGQSCCYFSARHQCQPHGSHHLSTLDLVTASRHLYRFS